MNKRSQLLCAWSGMAFLLIWLVGFGIIAGFLPPPAPDATADQLVEYFAAHRTAIPVGICFAMLGTGFLAPWLAVMSVQLKRIEGRHSPFTYTNIAMSSILMVAAFNPLFYLQVLQFRADHTPGEVRLLSDMTWLPFVGYIGPALVQWTCIGLVILFDQRERPILPRWAGYLNLWVALLTIPGFALYFFKTGPLAWNGVFCFWIPLTAFGVWLVAMTVVLIQAINRQAADPDEALDAATQAAVDAAVERALARLETR